MLEKYLDTGGIDYYLLPKDGWSEPYEHLASFTLIPSEGLKNHTSYLFSERDPQDREIANGYSSFAWHIYGKSTKDHLKEIIPEDSIESVLSAIDLYDLHPTTYIEFLYKLLKRGLKGAVDIRTGLQPVDNVRNSGVALRITPRNMHLLCKTW